MATNTMPAIKPKPTVLTFTLPARVNPEDIDPLRAIMFDSFPPSQRGDFDRWLNGIAEGRHWLYLAETHRTPIGFATIHPWITADAHLLEYLAVAREYRGKNYGAALLQHVIRSVGALGKAEGIILEVESDDDGTAAERELRKRRIGFYERNGAQLVECAPRFRVPNMIPGGEPLLEKLMWIPLHDHAAPSRGAKLRDCVIGIYTLDYGRSADDTLLQEALNELEC